VNPRITVPMHYWWDGAVNEYIQDNARVKTLNGQVLKISKQELPQPTQIVVFPSNSR
jgi:hypothetical protein